jgi:riboflavin kinase/FMN adenylyltransferase
MKIFFDLSELEVWEKPIVTQGTFDGIHLGHQTIFKEMVKQKDLMRRNTLLVTYEPHPQSITSPEDSPLILTTLEEKLSLLRSLPEEKKPDGVLVLKFTDEFSHLSAEGFIEKILIGRLKIGELVIGQNHAFGTNRSGGVELLQKAKSEYGFELKVVPFVLWNEKRISSSRIRKELLEGNFEQACLMLGHSYLIAGKPIKGQGIGREIGYPTINIEVPETKLLPKKGVYGVEVEIKDEKFYGMMYIGRKYILDEQKLSIEVNLFDYPGGQIADKIMIHLQKWIREEKQFDSLKQLRTQLTEDEKKIRQLLN